MSRERGPVLLLAAAVALPLLAAFLLATAAEPPARTADREAFQRLVGGLGLGASVDLSRCAAAFDPRDGRACSHRHDPVPGGSLLCPPHSRE